MPWRAHLNSGPRDDEYIVVEQPIFYVLKMASVAVWTMGREEPEAVPIHNTLGTYAMRRMFNGDPVPHDLTGAVEFDWEGWDGE